MGRYNQELSARWSFGSLYSRGCYFRGGVIIQRLRYTHLSSVYPPLTPSHPHILTPSHPHILTPSHPHSPSHPHTLTSSLPHILTHPHSLTSSLTLTCAAAFFIVSLSSSRHHMTTLTLTPSHLHTLTPSPSPPSQTLEAVALTTAVGSVEGGGEREEGEGGEGEEGGGTEAETKVKSE